MIKNLPETKFIKTVSVLKCNLPFVDGIYQFGSLSIDGAATVRTTIRLIMFNGTHIQDFTNEDYATLLKEVDEYLELEHSRLNYDTILG